MRSAPSSTTTWSARIRRRRSSRSPSTTTTSGSSTSSTAAAGRPPRRGRAGQEQHPAARPDRLRQDATSRRRSPGCSTCRSPIADATALTEAGYVGEDVENILLKLIQAADFDVKKAETGIIYIDEIDKIARKSENPSITRDVSRRGRAAGAAEDPRGHGRRPCRRRAGASTRTRSSSRSTPRTCCSSAAVRSPGSTDHRAPHRPQGRRLPRHGPLQARQGPGRAVRPGAAGGPAQVRADPRVRRPPADDRGRPQPRSRGARRDPRRAEERAGQAVPQVLRVRRRRARVHPRRARGDRRSGAAAGHRRPWPAGDPRRGAAQHDVRPARPQRRRPVVIDGDDRARRRSTRPSCRASPRAARPRRAAC